jgi:hypothetical protein
MLSFTAGRVIVGVCGVSGRTTGSKMVSRKERRSVERCPPLISLSAAIASLSAAIIDERTWQDSNGGAHHSTAVRTGG